MSKAEKWRGIKPLYSTRADVELLIGQPDKPDGRLYKLKNENVFIEYSDGKCSSPKDWNVPQNTVLSIGIYPRTGSLLLSNLKLDKSKFKVNDTLQLQSVEYRNDEEGIVYKVENGKYVNEMYYYPSSKDKHLSCASGTNNLTLDELRDIKPLYSTREDVEKLLGQSVKPNNSLFILKTASVEINYSDGACDTANDWNVPKDTVISVKIRPKDLMLLSDLKLDKTKFKVISDISPTTTYYKNEEDGITYEVNNGGDVINSIDVFYYHPTAKDNHLRCFIKIQRKQ